MGCLLLLVQVQSSGRSTAKEMTAMASQLDERYHVSESAASIAKVLATHVLHMGPPLIDWALP